ncbi:MAG: phosphoribosyltransferase [Acidobacteria bacterium]|nr:phosphoribosyltransferase [Acidobacteriota bacterium]
MRWNASGAVRRAWRGSRRAADGLLAVLLAPRCLACDRPLDAPTRGPVCGACWDSIRPLPPPLCRRCGEPLASWRVTILPEAPAAGSGVHDAAMQDGTPVCARCRAPGPIAVGRAAGAYAGALRQLIHAMKYDGREGLAAPLAALMRQRGAEALDGAAVLVPVPLHWRRRWRRGFNQAEALAARLGLPVRAALVRSRATSPQFGLPAGRRDDNVRGAFRPARRRRARQAVRGAVVVLVDDVATTGATLRACAEVLKGMGAREVRALTAARAASRRP